MKNILILITLITLSACAGGKLGRIAKPLERGLINKETLITVHPVTTRNIDFDGDKAQDKIRTRDEKREIESSFGRMIVRELSNKGYRAKEFNKKTNSKEGVIVKGNVRLFDHGSGAARAMVGFGAGSSNMFTNFEVTDAKTGKILSQFEIIATSGGRGGLMSMGSFMDAHLDDGSEKAALYLIGKE